MNQAMKKAKETFAQGNYTCVWCRDNELLTSKEAGLRPLLTRIREGKDLNGFYAADKIVGRAAAFLLCEARSSRGVCTCDEQGCERAFGGIQHTCRNRGTDREHPKSSKYRIMSDGMRSFFL